MKKSKPSPLPDPICTRCGVNQNAIVTGYFSNFCIGDDWGIHDFPDPTQQAFETTLRKKGDKQYRLAKKVAKAGIESEYHTGQADKMVRKLDQEQGVDYTKDTLAERLDKIVGEFAKDNARHKKLLHNIWIVVGVSVVILLGYGLSH